MPDPLFERLYGETMAMNWQPVDQIERRGRQRAARQRLGVVAGACVAVLLVVGAAAVAFAGRPAGHVIEPGSPTPTSTTPGASATSPTSSTNSTNSADSTNGTGPVEPPLVTRVPPAAMLRPADAGAGVWTPGITSGDWSIAFTLGLCGRDGAGGFHGKRLDTRDQALEHTGDDAIVLQRVAAFAVGDAERELDGLRADVLRCGQFTIPGGGGEITMSIVARSFAGQGSFLVDIDSPGGRFRNAVVIVGNLLTEVAASPNDEARVTQLAQRAAARLCAVTGRC